MQEIIVWIEKAAGVFKGAAVWLVAAWGVWLTSRDRRRDSRQSELAYIEGRERQAREADDAKTQIVIDNLRKDYDRVWIELLDARKEREEYRLRIVAYETALARLGLNPESALATLEHEQQIHDGSGLNRKHA